jgi:hypothetical protein
MSAPVLADQARLLVVLHTAAAIVLIGSVTHHTIITIGYLRGRASVRLGRIYAIVGASAYAVTFLFGLLAYPTFRYQVRGLHLDRDAPWASNLFDTKETMAALGLPLVVGVLLLSRVMRPAEDRGLLVTYAGMVFLVAANVWFDVFAGLVITMARSV